MSIREDIVCAKVWLKAGSEARVREWANYINEHRNDALRTLHEEGVTIESVFFDPNENTPYLIYYMRSASEIKALAAVEKSIHAIDEYHKNFKRDTWIKVDRMELLVDLCQAYKKSYSE